MTRNNTKTAFTFSLAPLGIILLTIILIFFVPSPALIDGISPIITYLCGAVSVVGLTYSLKSLKDKNTIMKWVAFVFNALFSFIFIMSIVSMVFDF